MSRAVILGVNGQDGSYLADILVEKGWRVWGVYHRNSIDSTSRVKHLEVSITLCPGDITDPASIAPVLSVAQPDYVFNMADQDDDRFSRYSPGLSFDVTAKAVAQLMELTELIAPVGVGCKFFQPCSALMFGNTPGRLTEETRPDPRTPYAIAKTAAFHLARYYRGLGHPVYACIFFNHDSPRRGPGYLLQRIFSQACEVHQEKREKVKIYNPNTLVDIGYAREYMEIVVELVTQETPDDWIVCSRPTSSVTVMDVAVYSLIKVGFDQAEAEKLVDVARGPEPGPRRWGDRSKLEAAVVNPPQLDALDVIDKLYEALPESLG